MGTPQYNYQELRSRWVNEGRLNEAEIASLFGIIESQNARLQEIDRLSIQERAELSANFAMERLQDIREAAEEIY